MRAAVLNAGRILVRDDVPEPEPALGQVLAEVKACGICGSDLHFARHGARMLAAGRELQGMPSLGIDDQPELDLDRDVYMGHEFEPGQGAVVLGSGGNPEEHCKIVVEP